MKGSMEKLDLKFKKINLKFCRLMIMYKPPNKMELFTIFTQVIMIVVNTLKNTYYNDLRWDKLPLDTDDFLEDAFTLQYYQTIFQIIDTQLMFNLCIVLTPYYLSKMSNQLDFFYQI